MGRRLKLFIRFIIITILLLVLFNLEMIIYGTAQGFGQLSIIRGARPIDEIHSDPSTPDSLIKKLKFVDTVINFSVSKLGLTESDNYQSLYDQQGEPVMYVVTGCKPYEFIAKTWDFPIVGEVPYKGYFNLELAIKERDKLLKEGWDSSIRTAGAYSTLGWFDDPIFTGMLEKGRGDLANLIIHELAHGTVFVKDNIKFNENLATFIGNEGTEEFLIMKYGRSSTEYIGYIKGLSDEKTYVNHVLKAMEKLKTVYETSHDKGEEERKRIKMLVIRDMVDKIDTLRLNNQKVYKNIFRERLPDNTYFMSFLRYQSEQDSLQSILNNNFNGNLKNFISSFKIK